MEIPQTTLDSLLIALDCCLVDMAGVSTVNPGEGQSHSEGEDDDEQYDFQPTFS